MSILGQKSHYQVNDAQFYMALLAAILRAARRVAEKPLVWNHKEQGEQSWRSADDVMKTLAYVGKVLFERGSTNPQGVEWKQMCEKKSERRRFSLSHLVMVSRLTFQEVSDEAPPWE